MKYLELITKVISREAKKKLLNEIKEDNGAFIKELSIEEFKKMCAQKDIADKHKIGTIMSHNWIDGELFNRFIEGRTERAAEEFFKRYEKEEVSKLY